LASSYVPDFHGSSFSCPFAAPVQKKLPALTTSQARQMVSSTFIDEGSLCQRRLASITYHQQRNYAAYRSHRKRHQAKQHPAKRIHRKTS
jgi:hypothetical protein